VTRKHELRNKSKDRLSNDQDDDDFPALRLGVMLAALANPSLVSSGMVVAILLCWNCLSAAEPLPKDVPLFLRAHCSECHAGDAAEGGFRIESLLNQSNQNAGSLDTRAYEAIYRQLSRGKMPPKEAAQPSADERRSVLAALTTFLNNVIDDRGTRYAGAFARRLNREELQNDLFDTLGIDRTFYNLQPFADLLPEEGRIDGFDTVGAGLGQSSLLLEQYQQTVDRYLALITSDYSPQRLRIKFGHRYTDKEQSFYEVLGERYFLHKHRVNEGKGETSPPPQLDGSVPAFDLTWQLAGSAEPPRRNEAEVEAAMRSFFSNAVDNDKDKRGHLELERTGGLPLINNDSLTIANRIGMVMRSAPLSVAATGRYKVRVRCRLRFTDGVEPAIVHARYFNRSHHFIGRFEQRDLADEPTYRFDEDAPRLCFENPNRSLAMNPGEWMVLEFDDFRSTAEVYNATNSGFTFDFRFESAAQPKTRQVPRELPAKNGVAGVVPTLEQIEAHYPFLVDVDYLEVEGPYPLVDRPSDLIPTGPADGSEARATAQACLAKFLPRLYRGPIEQSDLDILLGIFDRNFSRTQDFRGSLRTAICAAYLSPNICSSRMLLPNGSRGRRYRPTNSLLA
jgi:hypothetical protein